MNIAVWLIWLAALGLMAVFGQTAALRWLFMLTPILFAASAFATWLASRKLTLSVKIREGGNKKQGAKGELTVINGGYLPIMQLRCTLLLKNLLTGEETEQSVSTPVLPRLKSKKTFRIKSRHCGQISVAFKRVAAVDYFGVTRYKLNFAAEADTIIMPDTFSMQVFPLLDSFCPEESDEYEPERAGHDISEVHQIRGYAHGDSLKQIHWKLTGKFDQLMVKQPGQPLKHAMLLFLDFSSAAADKTPPKCFDALAEVAVSLSQALLDAGIAHLVAWRLPSGELAHASVQNTDDLTEALPEMLVAHERDAAEKELSENPFNSLSFSQMIWLCTEIPSLYFDTNARITVLCCKSAAKKAEVSEQGGVVFFSPESYLKDMAKLVL